MIACDIAVHTAICVDGDDREGAVVLVRNLMLEPARTIAGWQDEDRLAACAAVTHHSAEVNDAASVSVVATLVVHVRTLIVPRVLGCRRAARAEQIHGAAGVREGGGGAPKLAIAIDEDGCWCP